MKNIITNSCLILPIVLFAACGGGGGGGGGAPATPTNQSKLQGTLRMPQVAPQNTPSASAPMIAGEVVVWFEPGHDATTVADVDFELVRAGNGPMAVFRAHDADGKASTKDGAPVADSAEQATCDAAVAMAKMPGVRCASPNYILQSFAQPNDPYYPLQWHYPQINLPQAWDVTQGSASVIVAVLDSGIVSSHPDFSGRLIAGYDMISNPQVAGDGDGRDPDPEDVGDFATPQGSSFHGTHVAGTIGANGNDGIGVAGVDWNCKLMNLRCLGQGGGSVDDIANSILFAAGLPNGSGVVPPQRADIINMSLGGPGLSPVLEQACNQAAAAGVLLIAAAGNDNSDQPNSPAAFDSVLSVGAVDLVKQRAPYSNFSPTVDIWAPGGDMGVDRDGDTYPDGVLSTIADDQGQLGWKFLQGTSMASPHVAGVAALIKAANPSLTAQQLRQVLLQSSTTGLNLPNGGVLVDALAAVQAANGGGSQPSGPVLVAENSAVDFGSQNTTVDLRIANVGTGTLALLGGGTNPSVNWLTVTGFDDDPNNGLDIDRVQLAVDRTGLANGVEQTTLTLAYSDSNSQFLVDVAVRLQIGESTVADDTVFVLLVDPATLETKFQTTATSGTSFSFAFDDIEPGIYLLVAGTDRDNDDFLGDPGELFGAYPSLDTPIAVELLTGETLSSIEFSLQDLVTVQSFGFGNEPARTFRRLN